ncbi:MAG TPA: hypothetical protein VM008_18940 [Phycisphaerae bacterium]|nr:hypothetical protein [Phycisphaerae bacterium]
MSLRRSSAPILLAGLSLLLSGCQALYFLQGKGDKDADYTFPKDKRVLVFVDSPPSVILPTTYATTLGNDISDHLFKNKATENIVAQDHLNVMRSDPTFSKLGDADIARATNADIILYVNITTFNVGITGGEAVTQGDAQAMVKVVSKSGQHLWPPNEPAGVSVQAHVDESLADSRDQDATVKEISKLLTVRIGRMFHKYSLDDPDMTK